MGSLSRVGSLKTYVSLAEYSLFYTALLQKRPILLESLLIVATPYHVWQRRWQRCQVSRHEILYVSKWNFQSATHCNTHCNTSCCKGCRNGSMPIVVLRDMVSIKVNCHATRYCTCQSGSCTLQHTAAHCVIL